MQLLVFGNKFLYFLFCSKLRCSRDLVLKGAFASKDSLRFLSLTWLREGCCCETLETPRVLNCVLFSSTLTCVGSRWSSFSPHTCDETASAEWAPVFVHVTRILWNMLNPNLSVWVCAELEQEASLPEKDSKTLSSDLIEYVQHMIREHGDNYKVRGTFC